MTFPVASPEPIVRPHWYPLSVIWQAEAHQIQRGFPHSRLQPTWQLLLLSDGSTTRHLQLLTGEAIEVDVRDMSAVDFDRDQAPSLIDHIPAPRLRRQVWLRTESGQRLAYATSWWEASHVDDYLQNRSLPIWASLADLRTELYRDIRLVMYGQSSSLEEEFGQKGPFWGRYYIFWHNHRPLTLIYEAFSPVLTHYLGPMQG
ncbi:chorismate lyase [Lyngbya confervoides]|uniref:Chorismate lyase n=1 Tax=Lyngbya confervoides BDU141951 TaxID=1574623 RepID=A0ABD4T5W6_9CYAN|nr:chorismate lyase [Lyngbya confervoides]MCM1984093.1 chorismate lyase [Lyngbya confervoides BDU141951]